MLNPVFTINIINRVFDLCYLGSCINLVFFLKAMLLVEDVVCVTVPGSVRIEAVHLLSLFLVIYCWLHPS